MEFNKSEEDKNNESNVRDYWDNIKHTNIRIIGIPEVQEKRKGMRKYLRRL